MEEILKEAYSCQANREYEKSIKLFARLKETAAYYETALFETAKNYKMLNNPDKSVDCFIELIKYNNNQKEAVKELVQTACLSMNYNKTEKFLKELSEQNAGILFYESLAKIYFAKKDEKQAFKYISMIRQTDNSYIPNLKELKEFSETDKNIQESLADLNLKIESDKQNCNLYNERGKIKRTLSDFSGALEDFDKAVELNGGSAVFHAERGKVKSALSDFNGALEDFDKAVELNGGDAVFYVERAKVKKRLSDLNGAMSDLKEAVKLDNTKYWFYTELALLCRESGADEEYAVNLRKALEIIDCQISQEQENVTLYIEKMILQRYLCEGKKAMETLQNIKKLKISSELRHCIENIEKVEKTRRITAPYRLIVTWTMHYECNYKCAYCYAPRPEYVTFKNNPNNTARYEKLETITDSWKSIYDKYGMARVRIDGGEPSIYPSFHELMSDMSKYHRLQIGTNLSFDVNKFCDFTDPDNVRIDASLHCEFVSLEDFARKLEILQKKKYKLSVSYVAYPEFLKNIPESKKVIENMGIPFFIHPFSGCYNGKQYPAAYAEKEKNFIYDMDKKSEAELDWRNQMADTEFFHFESDKETAMSDETGEKIRNIISEEYITNKKNGRFKKCEMGRMYARMYPNGNTYRCCLFNENTYLGNLFDKSVKLLEEPEKCYYVDSCRCWRCMVPNEESRWFNTWVDDWETEILEKK